MTQSGRFVPMLLESAVLAKCSVAVLRDAGPAPDHPLHPAHPESAYLTCVTLAVTR